jgi:threonine dehydrogenase-like Zn-dependent dehydrogenase
MTISLRRTALLLLAAASVARAAPAAAVPDGPLRVGTPGTFRAAVEAVAFTGRVVYIGYAKEPVSYETRLFVQKELDIRGSRNASPEDFREVVDVLSRRAFPVDETITCVVPLDHTGAALEQWASNPGGFRKILVSVDGEAL